MVLLFILMGFGFFFIRSFAQVLGENGQLAIAIVAWTPPVSAILLSVGLILRLEDG
jgi:lipopolysaccharide export system permease protein